MFVFKRLKKIAIKNYKKNAILLLSIFISKYLKDFILITKSNYVFNIIKTTNLKSIDTNLKKLNSNLTNLILELKKERYNIF